MEATGSIAAGEGAAALAYIKSRRGLSPRQRSGILLLSLAVVSLPLAAWYLGSWLDALAVVELVVIGAMVGGLATFTLIEPSLRKALAKRGQPAEYPLTVRLTHDAVVSEYADVTTAARWICVTDLFCSRKTWVFLAQTISISVPRRFFPSPQDERAFIAKALSLMTAEARARSPDAERVCRGT